MNTERTTGTSSWARAACRELHWSSVSVFSAAPGLFKPGCLGFILLKTLISVFWDHSGPHPIYSQCSVVLAEGTASLSTASLCKAVNTLCVTPGSEGEVSLSSSAQQGAVENTGINIKKWGTKYKIRAGLELNEGFGEVKRKRDEAGAEPAWIFRKVSSVV